MRAWGSPWWSSLVILAALGCAEDQASGTSPNAAAAGDGSVAQSDGSVAQSDASRTGVGPEGGTLTLDTLVLIVPRNALSEIETITLRLADPQTANLPRVTNSQAFDIEPEGLVLNREATVQVGLSSEPKAPVLVLQHDGTSRVIEADVTGGVATATITVFGTVVVADAFELSKEPRFASDPVVLTLTGQREPADSGEPTLPQDGSNSAANDAGVAISQPGAPSSGTTVSSPDPQEAGAPTSSEPNSTSDDSCKPGEGLVNGDCIACAEGTFSAGGFDVCEEWSTCATGDFEVTPPSATRDRECSPVSVCSPGSFMVREASEVEGRICAPCPEGTWSGVTNALTCQVWSVCAPNQYQQQAPSNVADRQCALITDCLPGEVLETPAGPSTDATCTPCVGGYSTTINAAACTPWTVCEAGFVESAPPSATTDRACVDQGSCGPGQYVSGTTAAGQRQCSACGAGEYSDTINAEQCTPWEQCGPDEWQSSPPSITSQVGCTPATHCEPGSFVAAELTTTSDRVCADCTAGYTAGQDELTCLPWDNCSPGTWVTAAPTEANNRVCTACDAGTQSTVVNASRCVPANTVTVGEEMFALTDGEIWHLSPTTIEGVEGTFAQTIYVMTGTPVTLLSGDINSRGWNSFGAPAYWLASVYTPLGVEPTPGSYPITTGQPEAAGQPFAVVYAVLMDGQVTRSFPIASGGELNIEDIDGSLSLSVESVPAEDRANDNVDTVLSGYHNFPPGTRRGYYYGGHATYRTIHAGDPVFTATLPDNTASLTRFAWAGSSLWVSGSAAATAPRGFYPLFQLDTNTFNLTPVAAPSDPSLSAEIDGQNGEAFVSYNTGGNTVDFFRAAGGLTAEGNLQFDGPYYPLRGMAVMGADTWAIGTTKPGCGVSCRNVGRVTSEVVDGVEFTTLQPQVGEVRVPLEDLAVGRNSLWLYVGDGNILQLDSQLTLLEVYHIMDFDRFGTLGTDDELALHMEFVNDELWLMDRQNSFYKTDL